MSDHEQGAGRERSDPPQRAASPRSGDEPSGRRGTVRARRLLRLAPAVVLVAADALAAQDFEPYGFDVEVTRRVEAELGEIEVPENRADPESRTIPIRFVRLATRSDRPASPIVYLAGGPGGAGTQAMRGQRWRLFDRLRDIADVIVLDQRGTGLSNALPEPCTATVGIPTESATTRTLYMSRHRAALTECLEYWREAGADLRGYTTWESAADIDAVRTALGVDRVSLLGISYGTHLALATLKRFPAAVDRLVLASAEGLDHTVKLPSRTDAYFERLQSAIDEQPEARALYPNVRGMIERVLDHVEANPTTMLVDDDPVFYHTLGRFEMQLVTGYMISDPDRVASILSAYARAERGDYTWFKNYVDRVIRDHDISFRGMPEAMELASGISAERLARVEREAEMALLGDALNFPMPHLADVLPEIDLGADFRAPVESDRPTLFLSGTLDGRTYPESHAEIAAGFSSGAVVTIANAGHNLFFSHSDLLEIIAEFFDGAEPRDRALTAPLPRFAPR